MKLLKGCFIFIGILVLIFGILIGLFIWGANNRRKQAKIDIKEHSVTCNEIQTINATLQISLNQFKIHEIDTLNFKLVRDNTILKDTIITIPDFEFITRDGSNSTAYTDIPFKSFLKSDTIILTTKNKLKYYISGFTHYAYLHYGMFGYLGHSDCRISNNFNINHEKHISTINKFAGVVNNLSEKEFYSKRNIIDSISKSLPINKTRARKIILENRLNKSHHYNVMIGIIKTKDSIYYLYKQKKDDFDFKYSSVNSTTGRYTLLKK